MSSIKFNPQGAKDFDRITGENVNKRLAIILDGASTPRPSSRRRISGGDAQITGSFTMEEAKDLAIVLRAGSLPAPVKILEQRTVGPSLGQDSIDKGILSTHHRHPAGLHLHGHLLQDDRASWPTSPCC